MHRLSTFAVKNALQKYLCISRVLTMTTIKSSYSYVMTYTHWTKISQRGALHNTLALKENLMRKNWDG